MTQEVCASLCNKSSISNLQLPKFILGNFATVQEVQEALDNASFPLVFDQREKTQAVVVDPGRGLNGGHTEL